MDRVFAKGLTLEIDARSNELTCESLRIALSTAEHTAIGWYSAVLESGAR
jgi:hypothetical protein